MKHKLIIRNELGTRIAIIKVNNAIKSRRKLEELLNLKEKKVDWNDNTTTIIRLKKNGNTYEYTFSK